MNASEVELTIYSLFNPSDSHSQSLRAVGRETANKRSTKAPRTQSFDTLNYLSCSLEDRIVVFPQIVQNVKSTLARVDM
jgi:hypothetical protein